MCVVEKHGLHQRQDHRERSLCDQRVGGSLYLKIEKHAVRVRQS